MRGAKTKSSAPKRAVTKRGLLATPERPILKTPEEDPFEVGYHPQTRIPKNPWGEERPIQAGASKRKRLPLASVSIGDDTYATPNGAKLLQEHLDNGVPVIPKDRWILNLLAVGAGLREIAEETSTTLPYVRHLRDHPCGQKLIKAFQANLGKGHFEQVTLRLASEAVPSIDALVDLRDGSEDEQIRVRSATVLLDKYLGVVLPKVQTEAAAGTELRLFLDEASAKNLANVVKELRETNEIDADFAVLPEPSDTSDPLPTPPDDAVASDNP